MQERQERMESPEVVMHRGRAQPLLEVRNVGPEQASIHIAELPIAEPPLEAPQDVPVGGESLARPSFDSGS